MGLINDDFRRDGRYRKGLLISGLAVLALNEGGAFDSASDVGCDGQIKVCSYWRRSGGSLARILWQTAGGQDWQQVVLSGGFMLSPKIFGKPLFIGR